MSVILFSLTDYVFLLTEQGHFYAGGKSFVIFAYFFGVDDLNKRIVPRTLLRTIGLLIVVTSHYSMLKCN